MKVEVIEWTGMVSGQILDLPTDYAELLIKQGKVKNVKADKRSRGTSGDSNLSGGESVAKSDENA